MRPERLIDEALSGRGVVFGSLPPRGRDVDVLVEAGDAGSLRARLAGAGYVERGNVFASFEEDRPQVVEIVEASAFGIAPGARAALFERAIPLEGLTRLCRPAPEHAILIAARRTVADPGLPAKVHARVEAALAEDRGALARARAEAPDWFCEGALERLERKLAGQEAALPDRVAATTQVEGSATSAALRVARSAGLRRPRPRVVALSGLDGAGKSTQAEKLREALGVLGYEAEIVWSSLADHPRWLSRIAGIARRVIAWRSAPVAGAQDDGDLKARGQEARRASPLLTTGWTGLVTLRLLARVARELAPSTTRGRVVVCDRYLLDARVHLRYQYGGSGPVRACARLLGLGFPRPRAAFLLDLEPAVASARKPQYDPASNERRRALYLEEAEALGVTVLDASRPVDELAAKIAETAWVRL